MTLRHQAGFKVWDFNIMNGMNGLLLRCDLLISEFDKISFDKMLFNNKLI